ncbi:hypothetical protein HBO32_12025 [Pseudomonas nitroreducens]|uniref:hypothetical protein n=1 Tax=Pseudomonas nitroreducens TaxID=46680 RepID=UPI0014763B7C|nr:hypothetical protein [Pseudomonas nitroreducens]NMZ73832.1 hypothetical protein [Pseudomonas nitroreducens]
MSKFKREERFIVIKRKYLTAESRFYDSTEQELRVWLDKHCIPTSECVVVESDWPEYETVWSMIDARIEGRLTPYQVLEQQVHALRQHKTDYIEAAEGTRRALEAEAQALREELKNRTAECNGLHEMLRQEHDRTEKAREEVAALRRFAGEIYQVLGALDAPENVLDNASDAANGDKLRHKTLLPFAALRARVVVPEGYALVPIELTRDMWVAVNKEDDKAYAGACDHGAQFDWLWQAAIDAAPRLNSKAVSEGLLRNAKEAISEYAEGIKSVRRKIPEADQRLAELGQYIEELGALLGEGKEHE